MVWVVGAAGDTLVETIVEVTVETRVIVEVHAWTVAVGAVATLVELEIISTRTPHVTLSGNTCEEVRARLLWRLGRRAARRSDRAGVGAAARFFRSGAEDA